MFHGIVDAIDNNITCMHYMVNTMHTSLLKLMMAADLDRGRPAFRFQIRRGSLHLRDVMFNLQKKERAFLKFSTPGK